METFPKFKASLHYNIKNPLADSLAGVTTLCYESKRSAAKAAADPFSFQSHEIPLELNFLALFLPLQILSRRAEDYIA